MQQCVDTKFEVGLKREREGERSRRGRWGGGLETGLSSISNLVGMYFLVEIQGPAIFICSSLSTTLIYFCTEPTDLPSLSNSYLSF